MDERMTCCVAEIPGCTEYTPCWRGSYDRVLQEYVGISDPITHEVLTTIWDYGECVAGGTHRCDGSHERIRKPLPTWILENLDG